MIYLIDGHNLIGKMPDIELSDPDDEEKLTVRLQNWARGDRKRRVDLYFDSGPFGGVAPHLSGLGVKVRFTKIGQSADEVLIERLKKVKNPPEYTLVTSDREIITVARKRRVGYIRSEEFVVLMLEERMADAAALAEANEPPQAQDPAISDNPEISDEEVAQWMEVFKKVPKYRPPARANKPVLRRHQEQKPEPEEPPKPPPTTEELKAGASMTQEDMDAWLAAFGDAQADGKVNQEVVAQDKAKRRKPTPERSVAEVKRPKREPPTKKYSAEGLSEDEVREWLELFRNMDKK